MKMLTNKPYLQQKLLILGGSHLSADIVKLAQQMDIYTIVTDWYDEEKSPAKIVADEFWNVSITDYHELCLRIKDRKINGIITGFSDSYLLPYQKLCEIAGLNCYATKEQFEQTLDKETFKLLCKKNDVDTVPQYDIETFNEKLISPTNKIVIKPVDNSGSRGIFLCSCAQEFESMVEKSLSFSPKKKIILEKYMECDDISMEYKIQDGEVFLSSICDRNIYKTSKFGSVTQKLIYPSCYTKEYLKAVNGKVIKMFQKMGLKNGVLFMQAFVEEGKFYFYEMGFRLSGGRHYIFTENQTRTNAVKELINYSLYGKMSDVKLSELSNPIFKDICCQISILCKPEKIAKIEGVNKLKEIKEIINIAYYYNEGESIGAEGTTAQIFARIHIVAPQQQKVENVIETIYKNLAVKNEIGENIIIKI